MIEHDPFEIAILFDDVSADDAAALEVLFAEADVSVSNNFTGAISVAVFVDLAKDVLGKLLSFVTSKGQQRAAATIKFTLRDGDKEISLEVTGAAATTPEALMDKVLAARNGG